MARLSVIIVNYNAGARLKRCLDCLAAQTVDDFEVIVIDNGSVDGSLEDAKTSAQPFRLIEAGENLGFAAANNRAAQTARGDWLAFLNPDAYARPDWLAAFSAASARLPGFDAFGSTQLDAGDPDRLDGAGDVYHAFGLAYRGGFGWPADRAPGTGECFAPCAAAAFYRRAVFERLGGFDDRFFCYGEDVDLGFRLRLAGGRAAQLADAVVLHEGSAVAGRDSAFTVYHGHRNRIWLAYKNTPAILYWPLAPFRLALDLVLFAKLAAAGRGGAYLKAMGDGYGGLARLRADRRRLQGERRVSPGALARCFAWGPLGPVRRAPRLIPIDGEAGDAREI